MPSETRFSIVTINVDGVLEGLFNIPCDLGSAHEVYGREFASFCVQSS
jgi:hypothetical protein